MTPVVPLLEEAMSDPHARLVLADWREERGEEHRADFVRQLPDFDRHDERRETVRAEATGEDFSWLGTTARLLLARVPLWSVLRSVGPQGILPFVVAGVAEVVEGPLVAGSSWAGFLWQRFAVPTTMRIRRREGNVIAGVLEEDFRRMHPGLSLDGVFHFEGVAVGRAVSFVVSRVEGHGVEGGLYWLWLGKGGWLSGSWWVPSPVEMLGELCLRRVPTVE